MPRARSSGGTAGSERSPQWQAKSCDFGMDAADLQADAGPSSASGSSKEWIGTYEYMPPEATGKKPERFGTVCSASDVFSFAVMLWEMLFGRRVRTGFPGYPDSMARVWVNEAGREERPQVSDVGEWKEDMRTIAQWMLNGLRPSAAAS